MFVHLDLLICLFIVFGCGCIFSSTSQSNKRQSGKFEPGVISLCLSAVTKEKLRPLSAASNSYVNEIYISFCTVSHPYHKIDQLSASLLADCSACSAADWALPLNSLVHSSSFILHFNSLTDTNNNKVVVFLKYRYTNDNVFRPASVNVSNYFQLLSTSGHVKTVLSQFTVTWMQGPCVCNIVVKVIIPCSENAVEVTNKQHHHRTPEQYHCGATV